MPLVLLQPNMHIRLSILARVAGSAPAELPNALRIQHYADFGGNFAVRAHCSRRQCMMHSRQASHQPAKASHTACTIHCF
jgi:hypothetical protein